MKKKVDAIVATDEKLQQFLMAVNEKSRSVKLFYKPATIRAFYLYHLLDRTRALSLARTLEGVTDIHTALDGDYRLCSTVISILDCALERIFTLDRILANSHIFSYDLDLAFEVNFDIILDNCELRIANCELEYYHANYLLVECLNSDCYVSVEVRQKIEDELLLPIADIEKRQQQIV